jgi:hypothetical protein
MRRLIARVRESPSTNVEGEKRLGRDGKLIQRLEMKTPPG